MLLQDKKGISVIVGYVLLISAAVLMSVIVYAWLKSYVPQESLECPDGTSVFIKDYSCIGDEFNLTLKNNGKFNIAGYLIRVTNQTDQELATIDLSSYLLEEYGGRILGNSVLISSEEGNTLTPGEESTNSFNIEDFTPIYLVEITPLRFQEIDNKDRTVICGNAKIKEEITCS